MSGTNLISMLGRTNKKKRGIYIPFYFVNIAQSTNMDNYHDVQWEDEMREFEEMREEREWEEIEEELRIGRAPVREPVFWRNRLEPYLNPNNREFK